uniref:F-box protein At1g67340-like n=1 Tax=Erigeron canadensis TaxID=72917 RepID=UPI001CB9D1A2|nr:F-box protein At1g67340-like [Erigeron canadensis]
MKTRRGNAYPVAGAQLTSSRKKSKPSNALCDNFDRLPDDIVLVILANLSSSAERPSDFISSLLINRRFYGLGLDQKVLSKASAETFAIKPHKWSLNANWFLKRCSDAGNADASYTLGMIQFYCFQNRRNGAALMAKAAIASHAPALYSLAIIQFNGSGGTKNVKDLIGGVTLCARAAFLGHIDALRELGYCLKDGYGISKNVTEGQRFLLQANARELNAMYDPRASVAGRVGHPANRFLASWFVNRVPDPALRICCYAGCGRPETRMHEFRRCSVCGVMNYCSRGCQARDWTMGHFKSCRPLVFMNVVDHPHAWLV